MAAIHLRRTNSKGNTVAFVQSVASPRTTHRSTLTLLPNLRLVVFQIRRGHRLSRLAQLLFAETPGSRSSCLDRRQRRSLHRSVPDLPRSPVDIH